MPVKERSMNDNLKIPYGIADFKRIRDEGYYYIDYHVFPLDFSQVIPAFHQGKGSNP